VTLCRPGKIFSGRNLFLRKVSQDIKAAAKTGVKFLDPEGKLGLKQAILEKVITDPHGIQWDNLYPDIKEFEMIRSYMQKELGVLKRIDQEKFVNYRFADAVCKTREPAKAVKLPPGKNIFEKLLNCDPKPKKSSENKEEISLSQLLFEKGVHAKAAMKPELLQELAQKQKQLEKENSELQDRTAELEAQLSKFNTATQVFFKKGVQFLKNGDLFEAAGFFNAVLASEPDNVKAFNNLAVIYYEMDMPDKAKSTLEKILELDPGNDIARENLVNLS